MSSSSANAAAGSSSSSGSSGRSKVATVTGTSSSAIVNKNDSDDDNDGDVDDDNNAVDDIEIDESELASDALIDVPDDIKANEVRAYEDIKQEQAFKLLELRKGQDENADNNDKATRLAYLMKQSEVFAHFLSGGSSNTFDDNASDGKKTSSNASGKKSRGRKSSLSEEAEDKELMKLANSKSNVTRLSHQPTLISGGTMRSYQLEGLNWLIKLHDNNINGILADEMGLGKTLQTIALIAYLREDRKIKGPHLIIVPKSTVSNWIRECKRWCPELVTIKLLGDKYERMRLCRDEMIPGRFDVVIASYESVLRESKYLLKIRWKYVIIDEAHRIKNEKSNLSKMVRLMHTDFKLLITGTPLQNNLHELWALLNFLLPDVFDDSDSFDTWFNTESSAAKENVIKRLHTVLRPFMLRRVKVDVAKDLPPKKETKLYIGLTTMQRLWYTKLLLKDVESLNSMGGSDKLRLLNMLMQLRKVCNHPYLFDGAEPGPPYSNGPHIWANSGKMVLLNKLLPKLQAKGSRVLLFCQMTRMLDILEDYLVYYGYQYCRIDGSTSGDDRDASMDAFNRLNSDKFIFILSTRAGGLGINLQTADTVILYDSDWNPQVDLQAMDRAHRIGQTKEVQVFRFITERSVEEKIVERADRKLFLDAAVIQQGRLAEKHSQLSKGELMTMIRFGADAIMANKEGDLTNEDIDVLLARGEERTNDSNRIISTEMQHNLANFSLAIDEQQEMNLFTFEGEDWKKKDKKPLSTLNMPFINLPQRERTKKYDDKDRMVEKVPIKARKVVKYPEYQLYDHVRLDAIAEMEHQLMYQKAIQQQSIKELWLKDGKSKRKLRRKLTRDSISSSSGGNTADDCNLDDDDAMIIDDKQSQQQQESVDTVATLAELDALVTEFSEEATRLQAEIDQGKFELDDVTSREKAMLIASAFPSMKRTDYICFLSHLEIYGTSNRKQLHKDVSIAINKTEAEIERYANRFFNRLYEISDYAKLVEKIDRGDKRVMREQEIQNAVDTKVAKHLRSGQPMTLTYGTYKGHFYKEDEDVFLVSMMHRHGYGAWKKIHWEIQQAPQFAFDLFIRSRNITEIQRRADVIVRLIEKEFENASASSCQHEDDEAIRSGHGNSSSSIAQVKKRYKRG